MVTPLIVAFAARHPRLRIDLSLSDERVNLIADRFDLVIRMGPVEDSNLIGRNLGDVELVIVAAPGYLERRLAPTTVAELVEHDAAVVLPELDHWTVDDETVRIRWRMTTGSLSALRLAVPAGLGIARDLNLLSPRTL